jgi:Ca-activated chloride channel family protein
MRQRYRGSGAIVALLLVSGAAHAEWSDWWWTQEQRAQQALDAGRAAQAAPLFSDPARRAYAEIKSGQYQLAAERLASLKDPEAQYNRGNALARAGDLSGAIAAYDAALARSAKGSVTERDARHNRELVARQLQQQQQEQEKQQQRSSGEQQKNDESQRAPEPSSQGQASSDQKQKNQSSGENSSSGENQAAEKNRERGEENSSAAKQDEPRDADGKEKDSQDRSSEAAGDSAEEREPRGPQAANREGPPTSERSLAVEQWLRQIPEDPGGLLRRKFLLEHRRKQQEARP